GEVNTWPGQAASSMPRPTNPAWSGSWPEPPPDMSATLPGFGLARRTNFRSGPRATMSSWAATKPSRLSARMVSTELISFFMALPPRKSVFADQPRQTLDEIADEAVEFVVAILVSEVRQVDRVGPDATGFAVSRRPPRMRL